MDDGALEQARSKGRGVIVATAHLGPPKFLMHWMVDQNLPLMAWTATRTPPAGADHAVYLDPRKQDERSVLLVKSALHLRRGGVLLGAADSATGERPVTIERLGMQWQFSAGLPALARQTGSPVVIGLALWKSNRVHIRFQPFEIPDNGLGGSERDRMWLEKYWENMQSVLCGPAENLRFLRWAVERVEPQLE
jgi:lauroyl/myristoyl acyltransferase